MCRSLVVCGSKECRAKSKTGVRMVGSDFRLNIQLWELSSCLFKGAESLKPRLLLSSFWEFVKFAEIFCTIFFFTLCNNFVNIINYILFLLSLRYTIGTIHVFSGIIWRPKLIWAEYEKGVLIQNITLSQRKTASIHFWQQQMVAFLCKLSVCSVKQSFLNTLFWYILKLLGVFSSSLRHKGIDAHENIFSTKWKLKPPWGHFLLPSCCLSKQNHVCFPAPAWEGTRARDGWLQTFSPEGNGFSVLHLLRLWFAQ